MIGHQILREKIKDLIDYTVGFFEITFKESYQYKYAITSIKIKQNIKPAVYIQYRVIGSRQTLENSAYDLNSTNLFASFRPDHAQIIVTIATAESLLSLNNEEMNKKFDNYLKICSEKFSSKEIVI